MPSGLYIDYNDGRPALEITAGLRAPAISGTMDGGGEYYGTPPTPATISLTRVANSTLSLLPTNPVTIRLSSTGLIPDIWVLKRMNVNGNTATLIGSDGFSESDRYRYGCKVVEVWPSSQQSGQGLLIADSTDFTVIQTTDRARYMSIAWAGTVTFTGNYTLPVQGIPFGRWSNPNVTVGFDGTKLTCRQISESYNDVNGTVTMYLVIFNTAPPVPSAGLNYFNASGQCTFSTNKKPFLFSKYVRPTNSFQDIGNSLIQICRTGGAVHHAANFFVVRYTAIVMSGNLVRYDLNAKSYEWTDEYPPAAFSYPCQLDILAIPNVY